MKDAWERMWSEFATNEKLADPDQSDTARPWTPRWWGPFGARDTPRDRHRL